MSEEKKRTKGPRRTVREFCKSECKCDVIPSVGGAEEARIEEVRSQGTEEKTRRLGSTPAELGGSHQAQYGQIEEEGVR